jgi:hypothetical protein
MTKIYVIIETPDSGAFNFFYDALHESSGNLCFFLLPEYLKEEAERKESLQNVAFYESIENHLKSFSTNDNTDGDLLLFFSPYNDLSNQFESLLSELTSEENYQLIRVITFIDANLLCEVSNSIQTWIDATAHFSDALCITNRSNENGGAVGKLFKRYEQMRYPMETYTIALSKKTQVTNILNSTTRRISHIFDPVDMLDEEENVEDDIYLRKLFSGNREKSIPLPFQ